MEDKREPEATGESEAKTKPTVVASASSGAGTKEPKAPAKKKRKTSATVVSDNPGSPRAEEKKCHGYLKMFLLA